MSRGHSTVKQSTVNSKIFKQVTMSLKREPHMKHHLNLIKDAQYASESNNCRAAEYFGINERQV